MVRRRKSPAPSPISTVSVGVLKQSQMSVGRASTKRLGAAVLAAIASYSIHRQLISSLKGSIAASSITSESSEKRERLRLAIAAMEEDCTRRPCEIV